jgi:serine/threonine protein phosphatase PrpC
LWDRCSDQEAVNFVLENLDNCDKVPRINLASLKKKGKKVDRVLEQSGTMDWKKLETPTPSQLQNLAAGLVRLALDKKTTDNVSVMIVWL